MKFRVTLFNAQGKSTEALVYNINAKDSQEALEWGVKQSKASGWVSVVKVEPINEADSVDSTVCASVSESP